MIWIGVDAPCAHKRVHQGLALSAGGIQGEKTVANTPAGWTALLAWAGEWPERLWAVEGAGSLGRGLAQFLVAQGERVHEVSPGEPAVDGPAPADHAAAGQERSVGRTRSGAAAARGA